SGFLFRADTSRSDFRSFESAPAASRTQKTPVPSSNLGFGSKTGGGMKTTRTGQEAACKILASGFHIKYRTRRPRKK
ncbi:MAG: hypothetical protein K2G66_01960, partial [Alistipes sp.]|nr:hypothetical protein [Alistipes sp.]